MLDIHDGMHSMYLVANATSDSFKKVKNWGKAVINKENFEFY